MTFAKLKNQFLIRILILSIIIIGVHTLIINFHWGVTVSVFPFMVVLFLVVSYVSHYFMLKTASISFRKFTNSFLLSTTVKLLLYLSIMAAYAFTNREIAKIFIFNFAALYFIYTPFDVIMILTQARKIDNQNSTEK